MPIGFRDEFLRPALAYIVNGEDALFDEDDEPSLRLWDTWPLGDKWSMAALTAGAGLDSPFASVVGGIDYEGDAIADKRAAEAGVDLSDPSLTVVELARSQLGTPYVWAASDPGDGFDCSGFTQWVLKRFGINVPHMASLQQQQLAPVSREELMPGDLVFFNYGRKPPGVADHVGIYIGQGMMIDASSSEGKVVERPVDWDNFIGGGATGISSGEAPGRPRKRRPEKKAPVERSEFPHATVAQAWRQVMGGDDRELFTAALMMALGRTPPEEPEEPARDLPEGSIEQQLYQGFMDAGAPKLARMVGTEDFRVWIQAESGWDPYVVSPHFKGHGRNYGLFQFWEGHDWVHRYIENGRFTASPYEQAQLVVRYFKLTPEDIRRYADQVRAGTYSGWG